MLRPRCSEAFDHMGSEMLGLIPSLSITQRIGSHSLALSEMPDDK
jgi:hypothetical protein